MTYVNPNIRILFLRPVLDLYGVKLLPNFVVIDQVGNIQYQGLDISTATKKVAELVDKPSLPSGIPTGGAVASLN